MAAPQHRAVIVGSGPCGMTVALRLARQGWAATLVDRDPSTPPESLGRPDVQAWDRSGVAQFHQPHAIRARFLAELGAGLPDVLDALYAAGADRVDLPGGLTAACCRRSTLDMVMRRAVDAEPGITMVEGNAAAVEHADGRVTGLRLRSGEVLAADLVVDAAGRRSKLTEEFTGEDLDESSEEVYTSRTYRLRPGAGAPPPRSPMPRDAMVAMSDAFSAIVFPHDDDTFSVTFARLPEDDGLAALRHEKAFDVAVSQIPLTADWTDPQRSEPISGVQVMAGLRNTYRTLREDAPLGLHAIGDSLSTTNPQWGRGLSLAVAAGMRLADVVIAGPEDPRSWREAMVAWQEEELRGWFDDGNELDRARTAVWRGNLRGGPGGPPPGGAPGGPPKYAFLAAANADPVIAGAVLRHMHMVVSPAGLMDVAPRVGKMFADGWRPGAGQAPVAPRRADLVEMLLPVARESEAVGV